MILTLLLGPSSLIVMDRKILITRPGPYDDDEEIERDLNEAGRAKMLSLAPKICLFFTTPRNFSRSFTL